MSVDWRKALQIFFWILLIVVISLSLLGYLRYLDFKKALIVKASERISSVIGQGVYVGDFSISFSGVANLHTIVVKNPEGFTSGELLRIKRLRLDLRLDELLKGKFSFRNITLYSPELRLMKDENGRTNFSNALIQLSSGKSTTKYQVDEIVIESGVLDFYGDKKFRDNRVDLRLQNISSDPGVITKLKATIMYAGNKIRLDGQIGLNDAPKKFNISVSSSDFSLSPFAKFVEAYGIDAGKTRISLGLHLEGDIEKAIQITSDVKLKRPDLFLLSKDLRNINLRTEATFNLSDHSLIIKTMSLFANGAPVATLKGDLTDLERNASYRAEIKIERLDLSLLNFMKGLKVTGLLSSMDLLVKGNLKAPMPEARGVLSLKEGGIESRYGIVKNLNLRLSFSSDKEISIRGEGSAALLKVGEYLLDKPAEIGLSTDIRGARRRLGIISSISLAPIELKFSGKTASLNGGYLQMEGMIEGEFFSLKNSLELKGLQYDGRTVPWLKSSFLINYRKDLVTINDLMIESEDVRSSATQIKISALDVEVRNLEAMYQKGKVNLKQCDSFLKLHPGKKSVSGDLRFSAGNIMIQGFTFSNVSGTAKFDEENFSLDVSRAEVSGGTIKFTAHGRTTNGLLPVRVNALVEDIDLGRMAKASSEFLKLPYRVEGEIKRAGFEGTVNSNSSLQGRASVEGKKLSLLNPETGRSIAKDATLNAEVEFAGKDLSLKGNVTAGSLKAQLSGTVKEFMESARRLRARGMIPEVRLTDIRNSFWDIFPDSLLYVGLEGSISSDFQVEYSKEKFDANGNLRLKNLALSGENGEYSIGPINGTIPVDFGKGQTKLQGLNIPSFEKSQFNLLSQHYTKKPSEEGLHRVTIGSFRYGFRLLEDISFLFRQKGGTFYIERFSADMFGGKLSGSSFIEVSNEVRYWVGLLIKDLSLKTVCDGIEPIKGFISGKVDGIANLKGSGTTISSLIGMADFWSYRTKDEKTTISKEFLQKIGGSSLKTYLGDRNFNKGMMSIYLKDGYIIFKELEISNKNFLGVTDLSVKVAPLSNRIALDHLLWTVAEAAERAKKKE